MNWAILKYLECDYFFSPNSKGRLRRKIFSLANSFFSCNNISVTNNKGILWSWVLLKCLTEVNFRLADKNGSLLWCNQVTPLLCGSYQTFNINMTFCVLLSEAYASSSMTRQLCMAERLLNNLIVCVLHILLSRGASHNRWVMYKCKKSFPFIRSYFFQRKKTCDSAWDAA